MKKFLATVCICCLLASVGLVFSACDSNQTANTVSVTSVAFEKSMVYAEYQQEVQLKYKVYPSNATPTNVNFSYKAEAGQNIQLNETRLAKGVVYINLPTTPANSGTVLVTVNVDGKTDVCTVYLKPYPQKLSLQTEGQKLSVMRGGSVQLPLLVQTYDEKSIVPFDMYTLEYETPDGIFISKNGVLTCAENYAGSTASITARIKYSGRTDVTYTFEVDVLPQKPNKVTLTDSELGNLTPGQTVTYSFSSIQSGKTLQVFATNQVAGGTQRVPYLQVTAMILMQDAPVGEEVLVKAEATADGAQISFDFSKITQAPEEPITFTLFLTVEGENGPILQEYTFEIM